MSYSTDISDVYGSDFVIEAVNESLSLKEMIISDLAKHCRKDVVIATNTSSISITKIASFSKQP